MSDEKEPRYVIVGAGAIGITIGVLLAKAGSRVVCIGRKAQVDALNNGVTLRQREGDINIALEASTTVREVQPRAGDVIILTTKSQATESVAEEVASVYPRDVPFVCMQNGVTNEDVVAKRFDRVYAGLVFFTSVQLDPEVVTLAPLGRAVAIGCFPEGLDDVARRICGDLSAASFEALASAYVMSMKWAKLVANLNNATHTLTGYWLELGVADPEMRRLMVDVREEGLRVLDAAGIAVEPPNGEPSPIRIRAWTDKMKEPPKQPMSEAQDLPESARSYTSMLQDAYVGRRSNEADYLNGEIVRLGEKNGVPTPYNISLLKLINEMFDKDLRPGQFTPASLREAIIGGH